MGMIDKLKGGLEKSRQGFIKPIKQLLGSDSLGEDFFEELEESLILGDVGANNAMRVVDQIRERIKKEKVEEPSRVKELLIEELDAILQAGSAGCSLPEGSPAVVLVMGVNGSGKTTTAAKLAHQYKQQGKKVMLVAGDTFRDAAIEQLSLWAERAGVELVKQQQGSDPSAVFFDALQAARSRQVDIVVGDTAGRLHTRTNLMDELQKICRVTGKVVEDAPHQVLLVVDATTGQNGLVQAEKFNHYVPLSGLVLTKIDGTARGGIALAIKEKLDLPICYLGVGEGLEDLQPFDSRSFVEALLD